jgi:GNAT superfamily N-acetyltransferase
MIKIREATIEDLDGISRLFDLYRQFYMQASDYQSAKDFLSSRIKNTESVIFIATEDNIITGFVQLYPVFSSVKLKRTWLLNDLFVEKEHRQKGIASMLIDRCKELVTATNSAGLLLETSRQNKEGNYLYPKLGFRIEEDVNFYFWKPD